ncbi:MAG: SGNH/GDSL hydrolase family protein, partial [Kiritimatiellae bacterium]|nr:SGNH/GDSL hydrolase family protein [Kiritimatiellia bacterium]
MKTRNIVALVLSAACAVVANGEITAPTAMPIQRTLNALEKSTAANPARVRMLFYGQSIVEQGWHTNIVRQLKERYPTAILEVENRAIGGFTSPDLIRTAESDLYPYYPDILFFHVYGSTEKYEAIIRKVRETTTAEIVLWTSHLEKKEAESRESIEQLLAEPDGRSKAIKDIAARYGCLFVDLRKKWCKMMLETGNTCDVLLRDVIHMRPDGP